MRSVPRIFPNRTKNRTIPFPRDGTIPFHSQEFQNRTHPNSVAYFYKWACTGELRFTGHSGVRTGCVSAWSTDCTFSASPTIGYTVYETVQTLTVAGRCRRGLSFRYLNQN
jgi:hypothetical protein